MTNEESQNHIPRAFDVRLRIPDDLDKAHDMHRHDPFADQIVNVARRATDDTADNILARKHGSVIRVPGPLLGLGYPGDGVEQARRAATENVEIIEVGHD